MQKTPDLYAGEEPSLMGNESPPADLAIGCFLGLALGDALGAPYEGGPLERGVWSLLGRTRSGHRRWTDDTQMSLDLAEVLLSTGRVDADALAGQFSRSYRWTRGYGSGTAKVLRLVARGRPWREAVLSVHAAGSFGNGAAMRSPILGIFYWSSREELRDATHAAASITHAHPLAHEGALLIALATADLLLKLPRAEIMDSALATCVSEAFTMKLRAARAWLAVEATPTHREVSRELGNGMTAQDSVVSSLYLALRFRDSSFQELLDFVRRCGGDTDTIGAMAGALWGAANGAQALPEEHLRRLEDCAHIAGVARSLWAAGSRDKLRVE